MKAFLLVFFLVYGGAHLYVFGRAKKALAFGLRPGLLLLLFMALMVAAPVLVRLAEQQGHELAARILAWTGFGWMGIVFLTFSACLVVDLAALTLLPFRWAGLPLPAGLWTAGLFRGLAAAIAVIAVYGAFEAWNIRTEELTIETSKIPADAPPLTIVQISDVHIGLIVGPRRIEKILRAVEEAKPDLLVSTGDFVDGQMDNLDNLADLFGRIDPPYGKYAVTGNHEYYAGLDHALVFTERAGFKFLRGESAAVTEHLRLAGVDDSQGEHFGGIQGPAEKDLLAPLPREQFTVLLKHRPLVDPRSCGVVDLQLSGHTHKGQIFPFGLVTKLFVPVNSGTRRLEGGCTVHVSRGTGTWGPPLRFLSPPMITVIRLVGRG